jgi:hypothetical protein
VHLRFNLMDEHVPTPAKLDCGTDVPLSIGWTFHLIENSDIVSPRDLCNKLLHKLLIRPSLGKRADVLKVPGGEALHFGEGFRRDDQ